MSLLKFGFTFVFSVFVFSGCADIQTPTAREIMSNPFGERAVRLGMTRDEVLSIYGDPNSKKKISYHQWSSEREEWFYRGAYDGLPVGGGYLKENLYLYFDGDHLTNISREPLARAEIGDEEDVQRYIK